MKKRLSFHQGFTLIELLVVIFIIAILTGLAMTNFVGARERAKDAKAKSEFQQLKTALRLYYNDYGYYPCDGSIAGTNSDCNPNSASPVGAYILGCGASGKEKCPICTTGEFGIGDPLVGCTTVYMKKIPDLNGPTGLFYGFNYFRLDGGQNFLIKTTLLNRADPDILTSQQRCSGLTGATCSSSEYCLCAD